MFLMNLRDMAAVTVVVLTALIAPAIEVQATDLFTPVAAPPSLPSDGLTLHSRVVTMDLGQVQRAQAAAAEPPRQSTPTRDTSARTAKQHPAPLPGTTLTFNLFDDTVVTGIVEQTAPTFSGGYSVSGRLVDDPLGTLTLVVNGTTLDVSGRPKGALGAHSGIFGGRRVRRHDDRWAYLDARPQLRKKIPLNGMGVEESGSARSTAWFPSV